MSKTAPPKTPCVMDCPVRATADIIEHKWATLIIRDLLGGKKRFSELEKSLGSISPKILSERLKALEARALVVRTVIPTVPPATEYELSALGRQIETVIRAMQDFGLLLMEQSPNSPDTTP